MTPRNMRSNDFQDEHMPFFTPRTARRRISIIPDVNSLMEFEKRIDVEELKDEDNP